jgi:hypothetical protein
MSAVHVMPLLGADSAQLRLMGALMRQRRAEGTWPPPGPAQPPDPAQPTFTALAEDHYHYSFPLLGITLDLSRLRRDRGDLTGLLTVHASCDLNGRKRILRRAGNFSVGSIQIRYAWIRSLKDRSEELGLKLGPLEQDPDWFGLLEDFCRRVLEADRDAGEPAANPDDLPAVGATQEAISFIREPEVPAGSVVAVTGETEVGKSTLITAWARDAIEAGHPVLILDRENPRPVVLDRMRRVGLADCPELRWWGSWCDPDVPDPASASVANWVKRQPRPPLVIVDSLSAFHGGDENDATLMRQFMNGPRKLASLGAGVIVQHHTGKNGGNYRGSSDFGPALDQGFLVTNISGNRLLDILQLKPFKSRYGLVGDITYHYSGGHFVREERPLAPAQADQLTGLLSANPGIKTGDFEQKAAQFGISRGRARSFLIAGVSAGRISVAPGAANAKRYTLVEKAAECSAN